MKIINIAIVGLGRLGFIILQQMLDNKAKGINIIAASELNDTPGKKFAMENNITLISIEEIINLGTKVDLIFDLTGDMNIRNNMRHLLKDKGNNHTVIVTENISALISLLSSNITLPDVHENKGY
jgi:predicted dinucleotide-utilizing enzyme